MKAELFPFQQKALRDLRVKTAEALGSYNRTHAPQVVSFTAPTGAGKTIIMASLIEDIFFGDESHADQPEAIFLWLSDSPQLNEQSKLKIDGKADRIRLNQTVTITEDSFDQEYFDDGHIYFLNTQKLSKTSNLTKSGDRNYTIWETLTNTARDKSDRFYIIIDEAHRGMQGKEAGRATTIMQKFIKGSDAEGLPPMPVVIGMSATSERFNRLVEGTSSTIHKSIVTADEVRASGLLKDRIIIVYPEENAHNKDMAILQAAADDWKNKWDHWFQYCQEQHHAHVYPVLVVQVLNGTGSKISDTDLDDCLQKIERRTGFRFEEGQVVHTFGQTASAITVNGLSVRYEEPSRIADDRNIRVVFFKENLSTGWDCPRAETMMSFRHANDATYIAQLLGRMVRTPMQSHILVDDVLNDVHLYLPYFDASTVKGVVTELQSAEGGEIPTDVYGESFDQPQYVTYTVKKAHKKKKEEAPIPGQLPLYPSDDTPQSTGSVTSAPVAPTNPTGSQTPAQQVPVETSVPSTEGNTEPAVTQPSVSTTAQQAEQPIPSPQPVVIPETDPEPEQDDEVEDLFDREGVMKFINDSGLLTYNVRSLKINNYLVSLLKMVHLLSQCDLYPTAVKDVTADIVAKIRAYIDDLKAKGKYDALVVQVKQFKLATQIFDVFGESVDNYFVHDIFTTTDTDIDRQFRLADVQLGNEGIGNEYGRLYYDEADPSAFQIDVILYAADSDCITKLHEYARKKFHSLNDKYRIYIAKMKDDQLRKKFDSIVSDGDTVSKHSFRLPETVQFPNEVGGTEYQTHLFVDPNTGTAKMKLNSWETGVIAEEEKRSDFVCWIRNPVRASWALCLPYEIDNEKKPTYPDFIIVRKDPILGYVIDILEPHRANEKDNIGKAKGFAAYAKENPGVGRIQLIRLEKDITGNPRFKRLDMTMSEVREAVLSAINNDELDHLFDEYGFFE
ncbi:MAG: DEAD/DEAH box helicase family protein [Prevotella sp.]|nr:DEAD/DEAH box helicase family protein [Prevotella sp.]